MKIIKSEMRTPDGTILISRSRHDYVTHMDENGKEYMLDGGIDYVRSSAHGDEEYMTVTTDSPHDEVREAVVWGTYGRVGDQPLTYIKLRDMTTDHIEAVIENVKNIYPQYKVAMINELEFREIYGES